MKMLMENWNKFLEEEKKEGSELENPEEADLNKDDKISRYERARAEKVEAGIKNQKNKKAVAESSDEIFAPNHYCVHHGGVQHEGKIVKAEAINHNYNFDLKRVTHYDMKLPNGTILENVPAEEILVTKASLMNEHGGHPAKKEDDDSKKCSGCGKKLKDGKCPGCQAKEGKDCTCSDK